MQDLSQFPDQGLKCFLPWKHIILTLDHQASSHLHFQFPTCTDLRDPIVPPKLGFFSDPEMDTYCLSTEMAQERTRLLLGVLILLMKQLVDDPLNHRVSGSTFQSQALSCSPAVHGITCHSKVTKARMATSSPHRESSFWVGTQDCYLPHFPVPSQSDIQSLI